MAVVPAAPVDAGAGRARIDHDRGTDDGRDGTLPPAASAVAREESRADLLASDHASRPAPRRAAGTLAGRAGLRDSKGSRA
jgi:hypothetical protein